MSIATMGKKYLWVVAVLGLGLASNAYAEAKVAVVDFNRLLNEWVVTKNTMTTLQNEFIPRQRDLEAKEKELKSKADRLQRDSAVMSETERSGLQKELAKGQRDLKSQADAMSEDFEARRNEEAGKLQGQLVGEVQNYAKTNSYDMVLSSNVAVYVKESFDITSQVLTYLQGRAPQPAAGKAPETKPAPAGKK
jgi:outer membrane protein